jgi:hypothetical protein
MHVKIVKTYACKNAIKISNPVNATITPRGNHPPTKPKDKTKPENTLSIVWPAIIFANNLTDRLMGLVK